MYSFDHTPIGKLYRITPSENKFVYLWYNYNDKPITYDHSIIVYIKQVDYIYRSWIEVIYGGSSYRIYYDRNITVTPI